MVVVGSTHTGRAGRVLPGSTAERLLHGSPCPVAVAPKGYAERSSDELAVIGCGYDASLSAAHALETAHRLAVATGARLRVIRAFAPLAYDTPPDSLLMGGLASYNDALHERATGSSSPRSRASTPSRDRGRIRGRRPGAHPRRGIEQLDLLLLGSRG